MDQRPDDEELTFAPAEFLSLGPRRPNRYGEAFEVELDIELGVPAFGQATGFSSGDAGGHF
jgi:hypothetical protein